MYIWAGGKWKVLIVLSLEGDAAVDWCMGHSDAFGWCMGHSDAFGWCMGHSDAFGWCMGHSDGGGPGSLNRQRWDKLASNYRSDHSQLAPSQDLPPQGLEQNIGLSNFN